MSAPVTQFSLRVSVPDGDVQDAQAWEELTLGLREALRESDVFRLEQVTAGTAPEGARGVEILSICTFIVTAAQTVEALTKLVRAIRWCVARYAERRQPVRVSLGGIDLDLSGETDAGHVVGALLAMPTRALSGVRRALIVANARYDDPALARLRALPAWGNPGRRPAPYAARWSFAVALRARAQPRQSPPAPLFRRSRRRSCRAA